MERELRRLDAIRDYDAKFSPKMLHDHEMVLDYARDMKSGFNHFLRYMLPFIMKENSNVVSTSADTLQEHHIQFGNVVIGPPVHVEADGSITRVTPDEARRRNLTYAVPIFVDVLYSKYKLVETVTDDDSGPTGESVGTAGPGPAPWLKTEAYHRVPLGESLRYRELPLCEFPVMVRSDGCATAGEIVPDNECKIDKGGYFIINGHQKIVQPLKKRRPNIMITYACKVGRFDYQTEIRSIRNDEKFRSTSTLYVLAKKTPTGVMIYVRVPYVKCDIPIVALFRFLGIETREDINDAIFGPTSLTAVGAPPMLRAMETRLRSEFGCNYDEPTACLELPELYEAIGKSGLREPDPMKRRRQVHQQVTGECLPHIGYDNSESTRKKKAVYLGFIIRRLLATTLDPERFPPDSLDFEGNKYVELCHTTLAVMFRQLFGTFVRTLRNKIFSASKENRDIDIVQLITNNSLTRDVFKAFNKGEVTVQKDRSNGASGVIQLMVATNFLTQQSHLGRINTPMSREGK